MINITINPKSDKDVAILYALFNSTYTNLIQIDNVNKDNPRLNKLVDKWIDEINNSLLTDFNSEFEIKRRN